MVVQQPREATLGILTFLLLGAAIGAALLLATAVTGSDAFGDLMGAGLHDGLTSGDAFVTVLFAFFMAVPFFALFVAALMGARAARTGNKVGGTSALTALYGIPLLWVNIALAMLLSAAVGSANFDQVLDLVIESIVPLILVTGATVGFAALTGSLVRDAFTVPGTRRTSATPTTEVPPPQEQAHIEPPAAGGAPAGDASQERRGRELRDYPLHCPRCQAHFTVSGERPLRIECPQCGKTGLIR